MDIIPFKPLIYRKDIDGMISPPFDAITPQQEMVLKRNEYNITYLTLPRGSSGIDHAKYLLRTWVENNVLIPVDRPMILILEQRFSVNGKTVERYGIISKVRIFPDDGSVIPHEQTFDQYVKERKDLMSGTDTQLEPIFLVSTAEGFTEYIKIVAASMKYDNTYRGPGNIENFVYHVYEGEIIGKIESMLNREKAVVADGHHRLEATKQIAMSRTGDSVHFWQYAMAYITSLYDEGVLIGGVHRIVNSRSILKIDDLRKTFDITEESGVIPDSITLYNGKFYRIIPRNHDLHSTPVDIVNGDIFKKILRFEDSEMEKSIIYTHDTEQLIDAVDKKAASFGILMPDWNKNDLMKILENRAKLPQKSTYFYPKIPSGIAIDSFRSFHS